MTEGYKVVRVKSGYNVNQRYTVSGPLDVVDLDFLSGRANVSINEGRWVLQPRLHILHLWCVLLSIWVEIQLLVPSRVYLLNQCSL